MLWIGVEADGFVCKKKTVAKHGSSEDGCFKMVVRVSICLG